MNKSGNEFCLEETFSSGIFPPPSEFEMVARGRVVAVADLCAKALCVCAGWLMLKEAMLRVGGAAVLLGALSSCACVAWSVRHSRRGPLHEQTHTASELPRHGSDLHHPYECRRTTVRCSYARRDRTCKNSHKLLIVHIYTVNVHVVHTATRATRWPATAPPLIIYSSSSSSSSSSSF